jgi:adenylate kinase
MIFIGGIHGVGKSFFCNKVKAELGVAAYSASQLIAEGKHTGFPKNKLIPDIDENQQFLVDAVNKLNAATSEFLLDGHFCLLDGTGTVTRIPAETFKLVKPEAIVVLTEEPSIVIERRRQRDAVHHSAEELNFFQDEEVVYATEIATMLGVPIHISVGTNSTGDAITFIKTIFGRNKNGG